MYWIIHNSVVIDCVSSFQTAAEMKAALDNRNHKLNPASIRFLPIVACSAGATS